jgi:hypothetical protein
MAKLFSKKSNKESRKTGINRFNARFQNLLEVWVATNQTPDAAFETPDGTNDI